MSKNKFHDYYAFVCHRSADKPLAIAIQRKLEKYAIPKKIIEENNYPSKHIRHVCVDVTEFEDNNLHSDILDCLEKSDKLIVICSNISASPVTGSTVWENEGQIDWRRDPVSTGWVGFEILNFINMDRKSAGLSAFTSIDEIRAYLDDSVELLNDQEYKKNHPEINPFRNIIPVVKDGDPVNRTCFHPIIKLAIDRGLLKWYEAKDWNLRTEIKAIRQGRRGNFLDLILAVLSPSDAEEFRRRDKIRRRLRIAFASVSVAFIAAFIAFAIDFRMPHVSYYSDYVLVDELPKGVEKLSGTEVNVKTDCYRITTTKYNKTVMLEHINSHGTPIEDTRKNHMDAPMIAVYKCRSDWTPDVCEYLDRNGIVQMTYVYATDLGYVTFQENDFISNQVYPISKMNEYGIPNRMKIDRYGMIHDGEGRLTEKMYMSGVNYVYDDKGVAGEKYEYDNEGRLSYIHFINRGEEYINNQDGIHGIKFIYDDNDEFSGFVYVNKDDENVYCGEGYSGVEIKREANIISVDYLDTEGNLINNSDGFAIEKQLIDKNMLVSEVSYYGRDGSKAYSSDGYHKVVFTYNKSGDIAEKAFFNDEGNPIIGVQGYAKIVMDTDANGNILEETYLGSDGTEILLDNRVCSIKRIFDEKGFLVDESYYGIGESEISTTEGYHGFTNEYDDKNRLIGTEYYGLSGKKSYTKQGYHRIAFEYDDRGNMASVSLYDAADRLVPYSGYWAKEIFTYNGGGQVTKLEYLNQFENPVNVVGGYATIENEYDDTGLLIQTAYYDNEGRLCDDYYINAYNVQVGARYFARVRFLYDDHGNVVHTDYYDKDNMPVTNYPFAVKECEYDETGHKTEDRYLDADGNEPSGYFSNVTYSYDDFGHIIGTEYFGKNGTPLETRTTSGHNAHKIEITRDSRGLVISRVVYDKNGKEVEKLRYSYDDNGREITEEYFDSSDKRINNEKGYAIRTYKYDSLGNQIREEYFDSNEKTCSVSMGYAICVRKYDANGICTDIFYYDENKKPVNLLSGYSHIHEDCNEFRNTTNCEFRDKNDDILLSYKVEYNENAQIVKESLYGPDGNLYEHPESGIAIRKLEYDEVGNQTAEKYYSANNELVLVYDELSGWTSEYDDKSLEIMRTYYGSDGKPTIISEGFASVQFTYDEFGREIERDFFDEKGAKINTKFGFASYVVSYDESGNVLSYKYFDQNGKECSIDGEVKKVELNLHDGDVDISAGRYNPESGKWEEASAVAKTIYNIYRIAYQSPDGDYDLMLQPYIPLSPKNQLNDYLENIKVKYKKGMKV